MSKQSYAEYLNSEHWQELRSEKLNKTERCEVCGSRRRRHVHHLTYREPLTSVTLDDLMTLCEPHHNAVHKTFKMSLFGDTEIPNCQKRHDVIARVRFLKPTVKPKKKWKRNGKGSNWRKTSGLSCCVCGSHKKVALRGGRYNNRAVCLTCKFKMKSGLIPYHATPEIARQDYYKDGNTWRLVPERLAQQQTVEKC